MPATTMRQALTLALAAAWLCLLAHPAAAQTAPPAAPASAPATAATAETTFDVFEYRIEGNSVLPVEAIERAVYPFLGPKKTVADVESARLALETAYRDAGYGTAGVDTPQQEIVGSVVVLQVVQAPVARLRVVGSRYYSQGRILAAVPALAEGEVPNFKAAGEQLALVNRSNFDRRVTPLLRPGKAPGTTEVDLMVEDKRPLHAAFELNNKSSPNTTASRLVGSVSYDNLWQRDHSVGLQAQVSPEDTSEVKVFSASYRLPLGDGLVVLSAIRSNSNTVTNVGATSVFGRGSIYGLRRIAFLEGSDTFSHSLNFGADYKSFRESVSVGVDQGFETPVHYLPFSLGYAISRTDKQGSWQGGAGVVFALRGLASSEPQFADKRFTAQSNFSILKADVARTQQLPFGLTLYGKLEGQLSEQALISNEQFVAGGVDSVRGYLEATAVGDKALRGTLELRSPNFAKEGWGWVGGLRAHAFAEGAGLWLNSPLPGQKARFGLLGTGVGMRLQGKEGGSLSLDVGLPLRDVGSTKKGDVRVHASGAIEF